MTHIKAEEKAALLNTGADCGFCPPLPSGEGWGEGFQKSANRDHPQYICIAPQNSAKGTKRSSKLDLNIARRGDRPVAPTMLQSFKNRILMCKHPIKILVLELASIGVVSLHTADAWANPQDGQVVAGSATITQATPNKVDITQTTDKAIIDWNSFSINANEHTQFHQPSASSVTLNRVVGEDPSQILGRLTANGQVFLVNPNGIYFGKDAQIDVAGLVASTHNIRNEDFLAGRYNFNIPGKPGAAVINEGTINIADTGIAAFVAPSAANRGVIVAKLGKVVLAAANGFTLDFHGDELLTFLVNDEVAKTAFDLEGKQLTSFVENAGRIEAQGGYVLLTAKAAENAIHSVINQSGTIEATSVGQQNGEIVLSGGTHGLTSNTGTLDASGKHAGETGGRVQITGEKINLLAGTQIDVSGDQSGGKAIIGGDYLGGKATDERLVETGMVRESKEIPTATNVQMTQGAAIKADALSSGNGGKVVVWADSELVFDGQISSKGGAASGNGGRVETSGKEKLLASGSVNASAPNGRSGLWFMDPLDAVIANSDGTLSASSISSSLNSGTNVTIASDTGARPGSITVLSDLTKTAGGDATLNLFSDGAIILNRGGRVTSTSGKLNVNINARYNVANPTYGLVAIGNDNDYAISSNGGDVDVEGLVQTYQGKAVATSGGAFRARTTPAVQSGSNPQSDRRGFIGIGPTPINDPNAYTIDTGSGDISMRATGGTVTLDNHALATRGTATLTAANVLAQPNILSFNLADEANRQNIERGLGGTLGYGANFPANDDNSTPVDISLLSSSQGLTVLGKNFGNNVYLSNNGYMRLDRGDGTYTPYPLTNTSNPIVAAYFGDVDTRNGIGNVYYGTLATNSNNKAVLTWVNAGYYSLGADKRNTFQLQLENLGQEINMRMSYDQLQWTTGSASGGSGGLGGTVARAGFSIPGTNQTVKFELPASGSQNDMLALAKLPGNTGYAGRWSFRLWSSATPPSKGDGRYEVAANSFVVKNDAGQVVSNSGFEVGAYPTGSTANESSDYRRTVDYGSRLDSMLAAKYNIILGNQESDLDPYSGSAKIYDMEIGGYNSRDDNGGVVYKNNHKNHPAHKNQPKQNNPKKNTESAPNNTKPATPTMSNTAESIENLASESIDLWDKLFSADSEIKKDIDALKDIIAEGGLINESKAALAELKLLNLKNSLQKVMFQNFSASQTMAEKRAFEKYFKSLITESEDAVSTFKSGKYAKGIAFLGVISAAYDLTESTVKAHEGDIFGALYSAENGASGIAGLWFPPIGIAGAAADLTNKFIINKYVFNPGDKFQNNADAAIDNIYKINSAAATEINNILKDSSISISGKSTQIKEILEQKNKLIGSISKSIENGFGNVVLQLPVYGSYQAVKDAIATTTNFSNITRNKLRELERLKNL